MDSDVFFFLSHRSSDKRRLKKLVVRFLDAGIPLWIDVPEKVLVDSRVSHSAAIRYGAYWADEIEKAVLDGQSYVLFCWSKEAAKKFKASPNVNRGGLRWELEQGLIKRRLVGVRLDNTPLDPLPDEAEAIHWADLSGLRPGEPNETFNRLLRDMQRMVVDGQAQAQRAKRAQAAARSAAFEVGTRAQDFDRAFVVYEADRNDALVKVLDRLESADATTHKPMIVAGPDDEAPDMFLERCWRSAHQATGTPTATLRVEWPREAEFAEAYRRRLSFALFQRVSAPLQEIAATLGAEGRAGLTRAVISFVEAASWEKQEPARIKEWLAFWQELNALGAGSIKALPVLCVWMSGANKAWVRHPPTPRGQAVSNRTICAALTRFKSEAIVAGVLSPFDAEQARPWRENIRERLGSATPLALRTAHRFDTLFAGKGRKIRVSMKQFAEAMAPVLADPEKS
jgi:hypothetical protein